MKKIALNTHVHLRTTNSHIWRPERHVDNITDVRRCCRLRQNTSSRHSLGSLSRLLKVPIISSAPWKNDHPWEPVNHSMKNKAPSYQIMVSIYVIQSSWWVDIISSSVGCWDFKWPEQSSMGDKAVHAFSNPLVPAPIEQRETPAFSDFQLFGLFLTFYSKHFCSARLQVPARGK